MISSTQVYDEYEARYWKALSQRNRRNGREFVVGKRYGPYIYDAFSDKKLIDCALSGGVFNLGHCNPAVTRALRDGLDSGLDVGLWTFPTTTLLEFQDELCGVMPANTILNRSVVTLSSTDSIDVALQFALKITGRRKVLAYKNGYHGHGGLPVMVTGSAVEGTSTYYNLPDKIGIFFDHYNNIDSVIDKLTDDIAAIIIEPMDYETWIPAENDFLTELQDLCKTKGVLLILDETRTGLGRSGHMWMTEYYSIAPDILITGKGLGGGIYPVSALVTSCDIYDYCINGHDFGFASSYGGSELSCIVGKKVIEISKNDEFLKGVSTIETSAKYFFSELCKIYPSFFIGYSVIGGILTIQISPQINPSLISRFLYEKGVLCHSVSLVSPPSIKFFPVLNLDISILEYISNILELFANT